MTDQEKLYARVRAEADTDALPVLTIGVLPCNWTAINVYQACQWTVLAGAMTAVMLGISAQELRAAMRNESVPAKRRHDTSRRVRVMERAASAIYSDRRAEAERKAEKEAKKRTSKSGRG